MPTPPQSASQRGTPTTAPGVDVAVCGRVTDQLVEAMGRLVPQLSSSTPPPGRSELEEIVASPGSELLLAFHEGRIVGTLTFVAFRIPTGLRTRIEDLVVDESMRGNRIAERLSAVALEHGRQMGARSIDLTSRPTREAANRLYTRMGFQRRDSNVYRYAL